MPEQTTLLDRLRQYKKNPPPVGYPCDIITLYSPIDDVHLALLDLINGAQHSLVLAMYGFDDKELSDAMRKKLEDDRVYCQLTLDKSQAGGIAERGLVAQWNAMLSNSVVVGDLDMAIGLSEKRKIMHRKMLLVDGIYRVTGSTNWSLQGEGQQDNELTVTSNPILVAEARTVLDISHRHMLQVAHAAGVPSP
jgi:phosphatidylserine/phosphatidylglycerophosphate/cardiolipin synthase-like enzyme